MSAISHGCLQFPRHRSVAHRIVVRCPSAAGGESTPCHDGAAGAGLRRGDIIITYALPREESERPHRGDDEAGAIRKFPCMCCDTKRSTGSRCRYQPARSAPGSCRSDNSVSHLIPSAVPVQKPPRRARKGVSRAAARAHRSVACIPRRSPAFLSLAPFAPLSAAF